MEPLFGGAALARASDLLYRSKLLNKVSPIIDERVLRPQPNALDILAQNHNLATSSGLPLFFLPRR
jgi:hypothetical protein